MTRTLLLDMDNTLLGNGMDSFIPAYLELFSRQVEGLIDFQVFIDCLTGAVQHALENDRPDRTLRETFDDFFLKGTSLSRDLLLSIEQEFYSVHYPALESITRKIPKAIAFVKAALEQGDRIAIATNPLFPLTAIEQRLAWAGLPVEEIPYLIIPSIETFHFAKPNPFFFTELLGQIGWPSEDVVMIGDDRLNDILPAEAIGIPTFWITDQGEASPVTSNGHHSSGKLDQILPWLNSYEDENLKPVLETPEALVAVLAGTPAALDSILRRFPQNKYSTCPSPGEWSLTEIICHLRDVEQEVHNPRITRVIQQNNPYLKGQDTDRWAEEREYIKQDPIQAFQDFLETRSRTQALLVSIDKEDWQRPARHTIFGPTTLSELVKIVAGHDRLHLRQILALCTQIA